MKFAEKLRLAMHVRAAQLKEKSIGAQRLSKETGGKLSAIHISELVDARVLPNKEDIEILSKALNVSETWLSMESNDLPLEILSYCHLNGIDVAAFNGLADKNTPAAVEYLCTLITYKETQ